MASQVLAVIAPVAVASAGWCASVLIRLALRIHGRAHSFGPCRGAGFLGLGTAVAATAAAAALFVPPAGVLGAGAVVAAASYVTGLLLLPGAAPTLAIRLRHALDGTGVGTAAFLVAWLLVLAPAAAPLGVLVALLTSVALATTVVTGLRAARHRPAALACAGGAALTLVGLALPAIGRDDAAWLAVAAAALAAGPPVIVGGARRADDAPAPALAAGGLAAHPLLALPVAAAIGVTAYHVVRGGRFDPVAIAVGLVLVSAVTVRETLAALDVRRYARRLAAQQERFRALVAGSGDVTMVLDTELVVRWQSPAAARQFGLSDQDVVDRPFADLVHPDDAAAAAARLAAVLAGSPRTDEPMRGRLRDGFGGWRDTESTVRDLRATPEVGALVVHLRDVGAMAGLQRRLDEVTRADPATGLPNERRLLELAAAHIAAGARGTVVVVGLYGLAGVNDLYGTVIGDAVLVEAARRLVACGEEADVVARLPGDRFAVLMPTSALRAYSRAGRLVAAVSDPYDLAGAPVRLTAAAGIAELPGEPSSTDSAHGAHGDGGAGEALRHAGTAATRARQRGPGRVEGYDNGLDTAVRRRAAIEQRLPAAIENGDFDLVYQPVVDLLDRRPVAVEALLRWRVGEFGPVPPVEVVAAAAELGHAAALDTRVLRRACRQLARWRGEGLTMAVNLSHPHDDLAWLVEDALRRNGLPAERLAVELATVPPDLDALRALGVQVVLQHAGRLDQLGRLPVDVVKVDRGVFTERALLEVVVELGGRLGFGVCAVGVENEAELDLVRRAGCRSAQGNALAPPAHPERVEAFLAEYRAGSWRP
jgi:diguanylate cyclase (GGDEF)-like protein/PAS domain S-box-containing protein